MAHLLGVCVGIVEIMAILFIFKGMTIMKKTVLALALVAFSGTAFAQLSNLEVQPTTAIRHVKIKRDSLGVLSGTAGSIGARTLYKFNDEHGAYVDLNAAKTQHTEFGGEQGVRVKQYQGEVGYQYTVPVNYSLTVKPHAGIGYERNVLKGFHDRIEDNRGYVSVGADAEYRINNKWFVSSGASYQRDINNNSHVAGDYVDGQHWGEKYEVEAGVGYDFGKTTVSVSPYYSRYKNHRSTVQNVDVKDAGVKLKADF